MRPLNDQETMLVFKKLSKFLGNNLLSMLSYNNEEYVLRADIAKQAKSINKNSLMSLGTCLGKFTKANNFFLKITSLSLLSEFCIHKIWLKESGEKSFLFGNNVIKSHLLKISDNIKKGDGVMVLSMNDNPIGFGVSMRNTQDIKILNVMDIILIHQGDIGEYLRSEETI
ncbi:60S ribosome subunit biogenesis protein NIP7 [Plasmodium brasilianum]|uniref:60S ribosome subunit biogenesis protein NIP7 homolog n=3 Tax=Plasmodium (Plasmodium) TaxID=418103 RepID=A0A1D3SPS5_PLAMA|nr:60S ribosome subunit biogenesis protein NIP7, putative [Plasmodium malariae]KAI4836626.1 60S ribosome subunit biogenesis protein NIP7 [Plasmodium brasilianum]SCO93905.1 60S ribosome subunit biogenesis protein NIP7, putative [Plasmodium malariae]